MNMKARRLGLIMGTEFEILDYSLSSFASCLLLRRVCGFFGSRAHC